MMQDSTTILANSIVGNKWRTDGLDIKCIKGLGFVPVYGFPGYYVSQDGGVFSQWGQKGGRKGGGTTVFLKKNIHMLCNTNLSRGYPQYVLCKKGKKYSKQGHRLVARAFLGRPKKGEEVCHMNGIRNDNRLENLRWDTRKNNHADKKLHGTWQCGEKIGTAKLNNEKVRLARLMRSDFHWPYEKTGKLFDVSRHCITFAIKGKSWGHIK